jgi:DNA polymerase III subunit chi
MRVDFYQLVDVPLDAVVAQLAGRVTGEGGRLLIVAQDPAALSRLDRLLWDAGAASFLAHGVAGGPDDARQPILLSTTPDAPNLARHMLIADGEWREAALAFDRAFFLFDDDTLEAARLAWKLLAGRESVERHYWKRVDGKWAEQG